jgi:trehalose 6-phosphate synthase/phosphatase
LIDKYKNAGKRLVLLDYDGTMVSYAPLPHQATPSNHLLRILKKLIQTPRTKLVVITGRRVQDIDRFLGHLPIDIIAEHGAMMKHDGKWEKKIKEEPSWKSKVLPLLNKLTMTCPQSFVEEKHFSLTWHYRNVEPNMGLIHSRELIRLLENFIHSYNLKIIDGNKVVEIITTETNKGEAIGYLTDTNSYDCILCIGDDKTDEDMFKYLENYESAITVKVGPGNTAAKYKLETVEEVIAFLEQLSQCD